LLGQEILRYILNKKLGYKVTVPDEAFEHDLKYNDAVDIIKSLQKSAEKSGVEFSLKLTNTLESINRTRWLPENEKMVYTSGRALHPISINLAEKLQTTFNGMLDISFSAGVDAFNVADTLACNAKPITVCSDLLKPGGRLVYCTCSLLFDEGEEQIADLLKRNDIIRVDFVARAALGLPQDWNVAQGLRTRPDYWSDLGGLDGFFMTALQKTA
jgi:hypothetical protein